MVVSSLDTFTDMYICMYMKNAMCFVVPYPEIIVSAISQDVGSQLSLKCDVNTVMGFASDLNISWLTNGEEIVARYPENIAENDINYTLFYNRSGELTLDDNNTVYQCQVIYHNISLYENLILNLTGKGEWKVAISYLVKTVTKFRKTIFRELSF